MTDAALLFWSSAALVTYVYAGYPAALHVCAWWRRHGGAQSNPHSALRSPQWGVSIVIAARNEGARLAARLDNLFSLDFPAGRRQIIVVSDGSTDNTLDVLAQYAGAVETVALPTGGKALALNAGAARAPFDLTVFADARQPFAPDALKPPASPFS